VKLKIYIKNSSNDLENGQGITIAFRPAMMISGGLIYWLKLKSDEAKVG